MDEFLVAFLVGLFGGVANLLVDIPVLLNYDWSNGPPSYIDLHGLRIDISTLRFSVSSFLALFGSSLLHLYMDSKNSNNIIMEKIIRNHFKDRVRVGEYIQEKELKSFPIDFKGRVLEVGCGARPSYSIDNIDFYGADITPDMIKIFKENYPSATLTICDVKFLPFRQNSYQLIVANTLLHHLIGNNPSTCVHNVRSAISELNRVLSSESIFLIKELLAKNYIYTLIMYYVTLFCAKFNIEINSLDIHSKVITYFLTKKKLLSLLKKNGFQIDKIILNEWRFKGFNLGSSVEINARARC